jgi:membrane fusion protein, multidrug efflux system
MSRSSSLIAAGLALGATGWLASGMLFDDGAAAVAPSVRAVAQHPLVEVSSTMAQEVTRFVTTQGDVRPFRSASARSQSAGRIAEIYVDRGERVAQGQPLLRLTLEGLDSRLREAEGVLERRQRDFDASESLQRGGHSTAAQLREVETLLRSAREEVRRLEEQIADTTVRAPFAGIVDSVAVEPGEYVGAGADVMTVIENAPLRTEIRVSQLDRALIAPGQSANVEYATGESETGIVCFISAAADPRTRTFQVEIRTPNAQGAIPAGISAEARIPVDAVEAHFVSPALLSLGADGALGVKTVDASSQVGFHPIDLVRADTAGLWVTGLPQTARLITLGQGFVQAGDAVRVQEREALNASDEASPAAQVPASTLIEAYAALPADLCARAPAIETPLASGTGDDS